MRATRPGTVDAGAAYRVGQGVDKSTITTQLRRLTGRGLVDRELDRHDARAVLVSSSAAGRRLHEEMRRQGARVLADLPRRPA